jgi:hypothetical protein
MAKRKRSNDTNQPENKDLINLNFLFPNIIERDKNKTEMIKNFLLDLELKDLKRTLILHWDHLHDISEKNIVFIHFYYFFNIIYFFFHFNSYLYRKITVITCFILATN